MERFEKYFGKANDYFEEFGHKFLIFNSQVLDSSSAFDLQEQTMGHIMTHRSAHMKSFDTPNYQPLIILEHIPLYKPSGICADFPNIVYDSFSSPPLLPLPLLFSLFPSSSPSSPPPLSLPLFSPFILISPLFFIIFLILSFHYIIGIIIII